MQGITGSLLVNYSGHGYYNGWRIDGATRYMDYILTRLDTGQTLPFFVTMTCLNGYFINVDPFTHANKTSLAEELLAKTDGGAVATLSPTGMTIPMGQELLDHGLFEAIFENDIRTLGEAVAYAKAYLVANSTTQDDVVKTFQLFGDPATELKIPLPQRPQGVSALSGNGSVTLSWQEALDCNSGPVAGYNIYRSISIGGPYTQINTSLITEITYTDSDVVVGTTYHYQVTSVDSDDDESIPSQTTTIGATSTPSITTGSGGGGGGGCFIETASGDVAPSGYTLFAFLIASATVGLRVLCGFREKKNSAEG
jgi:hypothetical protein